MNFSDPSNMFEWIVYIANEYKYMFLEGLWITLYIAVIGTLVGFIVVISLVWFRILKSINRII